MFFNGLCLFDIDGTLTTGTDNHRVVETCLKNGYAVGVATAGAKYTPENVRSYGWMPENLYQFMESSGFCTFNNVSLGILAGKYDTASYIETELKKPPDVFWPGWLKGLALDKTSEACGIHDPSQVFLFENDPSYMKGVNRYNSLYNTVCCGKSLDFAVVNTIFNNHEKNDQHKQQDNSDNDEHVSFNTPGV